MSNYSHFYHLVKHEPNIKHIAGEMFLLSNLYQILSFRNFLHRFHGCGIWGYKIGKMVCKNTGRGSVDKGLISYSFK